METGKKPHVVILGAGFGGVYVAKELAPQVMKGKIRVTIVNRTNYFLFTPLLHEVATGGLSPNSVAEPLRGIFEDTGIETFQGEISSVDTEKQVVKVGCAEIAYDHLVVATGAENNYYGIPGADTLAYSLKNLADAARIRDKVIDAFEEAVLDHSKGNSSNALRFVVVGGGATGVETAAELAEFLCEIQSRYYGKVHFFRKQDISITLVAGAGVLKQYHDDIQKVAERRLQHKGILVIKDEIVSEVSSGKVSFKSGKDIPAGVVIWAAGVKPQLPPFQSGGSSPLLTGGRITTNEFMQALGGEPGKVLPIFALGDSASLQGQNIPMLAQVAVAQAPIVAKNILASIAGKPMVPYTVKIKGTLVSLGQWFAAGQAYKFSLYGKFAWWLWRTVYLFKFASNRKRVRIMFEWTFDLFTARDITKLH